MPTFSKLAGDCECHCDGRIAARAEAAQDLSQTASLSMLSDTNSCTAGDCHMIDLIDSIVKWLHQADEAGGKWCTGKWVGNGDNGNWIGAMVV